MKGERCRGAESACRAVGLAEAEGALHCVWQAGRATAFYIVCRYGIWKDAPPGGHDVATPWMFKVPTTNHQSLITNHFSPFDALNAFSGQASHSLFDRGLARLRTTAINSEASTGFGK